MQILAVTKQRSISEVEKLLQKYPEIKAIGENRWPDCEEKFKHFSELERHFIGPLQSNKFNKIVPIVDVIQSVDKFEYLEKLNKLAKENNKTLKFTFQVNISEDPNKRGLNAKDLKPVIEKYLASNFENLKLIGLMTIILKASSEDCQKYFRKMHELFAAMQKTLPMNVLSMGMSSDYKEAIKEGATMVRIGRALFESEAHLKGI